MGVSSSYLCPINYGAQKRPEVGDNPPLILEFRVYQRRTSVLERIVVRSFRARVDPDGNYIEQQ